MKVLKIVCSEWKNASRDKRELSVVKELGAEAVVMAKGQPGDKFEKDKVDGFDVYRFSTKPLGTSSAFAIPNRIVSIFTWAYYARKMKAEVLSCHDLGALVIGWLSTLFVSESKKPKLVYDSHEYTLGLAVFKNKYKRAFAKFAEKFLMKKCAFSIMVNDEIAEKVQEIHKLKVKPISVKNTPDKWELEPEKAENIRKSMLSSFGMDDAFIAMYHGAIIPKRGVEVFIEAIAKNENVYGIVLGNFATQDFENQIKLLVEKSGVTERVLFLPAVPHSELKNYICAVDCGVSLLQNTCENHLYALPNKFFECVQCLTPVVVSNFPAISNLVDKYNIGIKCDPESPEDVAHSFELMCKNKEMYSMFSDNMVKAKEDLCWENEKEVLIEAYRKML